VWLRATCDRSGSPYGCARVGTRCIVKTSVGLCGQSRDPRKLQGVASLAPGWPGSISHMVMSPQTFFFLLLLGSEAYVSYLSVTS
jgi:hypothetical protein